MTSDELPHPWVWVNKGIHAIRQDCLMSLEIQYLSRTGKNWAGLCEDNFVSIDGTVFFATWQEAVKAIEAYYPKLLLDEVQRFQEVSNGRAH